MQFAVCRARGDAVTQGELAAGWCRWAIAGPTTRRASMAQQNRDLIKFACETMQLQSEEYMAQRQCYLWPLLRKSWVISLGEECGDADARASRSSLSMTTPVIRRCLPISQARYWNAAYVTCLLLRTSSSSARIYELQNARNSYWLAVVCTSVVTRYQSW